jgi:class 3 adenylate cyclase/ABC-type glycerol-3-phosphate transport system substrate-binding protein
MERRLAAILSADVVGYSRLMGEDEAGTLAALMAHRNGLIDPKIADHNGRIVKLMGDGALVEFPSVVEAVRCAVEIQRGMAERNIGVTKDRRIEFRIGINLGDVMVEGDDLYGDGVNVAARLEALAEPGGVYVSRGVYDQIKNKLRLGFQDLGEHEVKNIAEPVRVYRVQLEHESAGAISQVRWARLWRWRWVALGAPIAVVLAGGALTIWRGYWSPFNPVPTLTLVTGLNQREFAVFKDTILPQFEKWQTAKGKRPATIEVENAKWEMVLERLRRGERIDLITFDVNGNRRELVEPEELIHDLTDEKGLLPSAVHPTMAKHLEINGRRYFIPFRGNIRLLFLNRSKYDELRKVCKETTSKTSQKLSDDLKRNCQGLPERPETWQQLRRVAEIFHTIDGEERVAIAATKDDKPLFLFEVLRSAVGEPCDLLEGELDAFRAVVEFIKNGLWPHVTPKSREVDWRTASGFLVSDSVYVVRDWTFSLATIHESGREADFDVYEGPRWEGAQPSYLLGGEVLALPINGRHPKLAGELLRFLVSRDIQRTFASELCWPAMRLDVGPKSDTCQQNRQQRITRALLHAEPLPDYWTQATRQFYETLFETIVDPNTGVEDAVAEFRKHLRHPGACGRRTTPANRPRPRRRSPRRVRGVHWPDTGMPVRS